MNQLKSEFPTMGRCQYHIRLNEGDIPPYVLLPGAPERVDVITEHWDSVSQLAYNREFRSAKGSYKSCEIACVSTGIGSTSAEICIHELKNIGTHTAIRIGTTGSISTRFQPGDLIIPVAAIRADGTSDCYAARNFPAIADRDVVNALGEACERLHFRYGFGIMYSPASLYLGQGRPLSETGYWPSFSQNLISDLQQARVTNIDTDSAGQFVVGYFHEMRMASILSVLTNRIDNTWAEDNSGEHRASLAASEAIKILYQRDRRHSVYQR